MPQPFLPYALTAPVFPFRHLAELAGRAPIGGAREVALGCFVAARLAAGAATDAAAGDGARDARSAAAKGWLATLTLPAAIRGTLARCLESTARGAAPAVARDLTALETACTSFLDPGSRAELKALAQSLA
ncbi:MAG: hypothetical protein ACREFI_13535 [Stellaceae bacterium]